MQPFRDILNLDRIHVFDGAMGTMLYSKGIYINRSYDELNLVAPDLVRDVHVRGRFDEVHPETYDALVRVCDLEVTVMRQPESPRSLRTCR